MNTNIPPKVYRSSGIPQIHVWYVAWITDDCGSTCQLLRGDVLHISSSLAAVVGVWEGGLIIFIEFIFIIITQLSKESVSNIWMYASKRLQIFRSK
jgi:hypothetical protein